MSENFEPGPKPNAGRESGIRRREFLTSLAGSLALTASNPVSAAVNIEFGNTNDISGIDPGSKGEEAYIESFFDECAHTINNAIEKLKTGLYITAAAILVEKSLFLDRTKSFLTFKINDLGLILEITVPVKDLNISETEVLSRINEVISSKNKK